MSASTLFVQLKRSQPRIINHRRGVRKTLFLSASIVTASGIVTSQVTDVSTGGCRLYLFTPLALHQYLALEVKLKGSAGGIHIALAQVQWIKDQVAGVEFVSLSQSTQQQLLRLCKDEEL
jgi:c-di-GMP-binding flagellar brake protein YcgR